jgi:hypothetical protein
MGRAQNQGNPTLNATNETVILQINLSVALYSRDARF